MDGNVHKYFFFIWTFNKKRIKYVKKNVQAKSCLVKILT